MPRKRRRGGRPSKYTPQTVLSIVADIGSGSTRERAVQSAGIGASTFYRWLQRGRAGDPRFAPLARAVRNAENGSSFGSALALFALSGKVRF